ncbi:hypothetical protein MesoLjLc_57460 [Mesorhizobium sp. L-8-10]|nr:hypothetical protein MesoLjLc_57460 [Mesorhizobium sp. L-8-10]
MRGRKEHDETVESGDTGGGSTFGFATNSGRDNIPAHGPALRSAPGRDRQIAAAHTRESLERQEPTKRAESFFAQHPLRTGAKQSRNRVAGQRRVLMRGAHAHLENACANNKA